MYRNEDARLIADLIVECEHQLFRHVLGDSRGIIFAVLKLSFVGERQYRKVPLVPRIFDRRLKGVLILVIAIFREQNPAIFLAEVPQQAIIDVTVQTQIGKRLQGDAKLRQEFHPPAAKRF